VRHFRNQNSKIFTPDGPRENGFPGRRCGSQRRCNEVSRCVLLRAAAGEDVVSEQADEAEESLPWQVTGTRLQ